MNSNANKKNLIYLGVNYGDTFGSYVAAGQHDHYYGFEANPELAQKLIERFKNNSKVTIVNGAVGDKVDEQDFYIYNTNLGPVASSLGEATNEYLAKHKGIMTLAKIIKVRGIILERFLLENNIDYIETYVSDIQGMDYFVLSTLKHNFLDKRKISKIFVETECEYTPACSYNLQYTNKSNSFITLLEKNYKLVGMQSGNYNEQDEDRWWNRDLFFELN